MLAQVFAAIGRYWQPESRSSSQFENFVQFLNGFLLVAPAGVLQTIGPIMAKQSTTRTTPRKAAAILFRFGLGSALGALLFLAACRTPGVRAHFPGKSWEQREPASLGLDASTLDQLAKQLGGRGCVVKDGYVVKSWGDQAQVTDVLSSAKPVLSTLLFFAIEEGVVKSVDQPIADFG